MSARLEAEPSKWEPVEAIALPGIAKKPSEIRIESLFRNFDQRNLVAPLREIRETLAQAERPKDAPARCEAALALQEQWDAWLAERDLLQNEIRRGRDLLKQIQSELGRLRKDVEQWATFERVCGHNPLTDYMDSLFAKERIAQFLPDWLSRREEQLHGLNRQMEQCARQNGLEHLV